MMLIGFLATTAMISLARSSSISYSTFRRREVPMLDRPEVLLLFDRAPSLENEPFDSSNEPASSLVRPKRIGSLSIVNPLDVLRQRVLLELARRKMRQDQQQVDANRRFLETIGKRSVPSLEPKDFRDSQDLEEDPEVDSANDDDPRRSLPSRHPGEDRDGPVAPGRKTNRIQDWLDSDDDLRRSQDDRTRRMQLDELHLL
ncbi:diuretic hormone 44 [Orussus abietinus]|uniref:diuretic hormone 44 n=1 Tax=Orussus abietinus TaxID=222816 RepID=UPI000625FB71|nr:diuretic hormone 44 [Orussus abietinus]